MKWKYHSLLPDFFPAAYSYTRILCHTRLNPRRGMSMIEGEGTCLRAARFQKSFNPRAFYSSCTGVFPEKQSTGLSSPGDIAFFFQGRENKTVETSSASTVLTDIINPIDILNTVEGYCLPPSSPN
ncbi:hypothetical protein JW933_05575 [candidate division FCPU426 bacterium]|nr:hypothetical protein [candidate division FCPU426 bacterium]